MLNRIHGTGSHAWQGVQGPAPQQGVPASAAPPAPQPAPVAGLVPARQPRAPVFAVRRDTTVLDTVPWNSKANLAGNESSMVLGQERRGDPRLGQAQVAADPHIVLSLCTDPGAASPQQHATARQAAAAILGNTEREYRLDGTPAGLASARARAWLTHSADPLTAGQLAWIMREVGEAVHAQAARSAGLSHAERTAGRMPMDCMTHFAYRLELAGNGATVPQHELINTLKLEVKSRVMQHALDFDATRQWLDEASSRCAGQGLADLARWAAQLRAAIPASPAVRDVAAALHDNVHGRALESLLIDQLVRTPPAAVKSSVAALGGYLADGLSGLPADIQARAAADLQAWMRHEPRGWQAQSTRLTAFLDAPQGQQLPALQELLRAPKATGADCLAMPYLTVKLSVTLAGFTEPPPPATNSYQYAPWMAWANPNYQHVVGPASARETNLATNGNRITPKAGITSHHQPVAVPTDLAGASMHPGDRNRPRLDQPSAELHKALEHGIPFVSGVSGSTNIVMHVVGFMRSQGVPIDARDALLATMMFLTHDGGHSMHEAMWVGNQLDHAWQMGMGMPGGDPATYVADYDALIASFAPETRQQLHSASETAWRETVRQFGHTSHFAAQQLDP